MARNFIGSNPDSIAASLAISGSAVTVSAWFNSTNLSASFNGIFATPSARCNVFAPSNALSKVGYWLNTAGGGLQRIDAGSNTFASNTWNHVALTYDTTNGLAGFLNGVADGTSAANGNLTGDTSIVIGRDQSNGAFSGNIADVAVWNIALNSTQRSQIINGVRPINVNSANLIGWWPLDGYASPETDLSGGGNNGTLSGTTRAIGPKALWRCFAFNVVGA